MPGPPILKHTTGSPCSNASSTTNPPESRRLGKKNTSNSEYSFCTSALGNQSRHSIESSTPRCFAESIQRVFSTPPPITVTLCCNWRIRANICKPKAIPFKLIQRPTNNKRLPWRIKDSGLCSSSGEAKPIAISIRYFFSRSAAHAQGEPLKKKHFFSTKIKLTTSVSRIALSS